MTRPRTRRRAVRTLPLGMPPRAWLLSGWALLPLRAFLGGTFLYAGLQKLANPAFFDPASPISLHTQMLSFVRTSPIHALLSPLLGVTTPLGIAFALSEVAVGVGMALGLWTRAAAFGGMALSFSLFLTVSFHTSPWYTGADIVFLFAFVPFVVAGAGGVLSVDAAIARRTAKEASLDEPFMVVMTFAEVQRVCGSYKDGRCLAVRNRRCAPGGCPYLEGDRPSLPGGREVDQVDRRAVVIGGVAAAAAAAAGLVGAGGVALGGRLVGAVKVSHVPTGSLPSTTGGPSTLGTLIGPSAGVGVGQAATFTVPGANQDPGIVLQPSQGQFVAYDAVCPHAACTVGYAASANLLACPCHGSEFNVSDGSVVRGPATSGLTTLTVTDHGGNLYVK